MASLYETLVTLFTERKLIDTYTVYGATTEPQFNPRTLPSYVKEGLEGNELVYACLWITANTAASMYLAFKNLKTDVPDYEHPLTLFMERPCPVLSGADFWAITLLYIRMSGVSYWWKARAQRQNVVSLWPLRPDWIKPILDDKRRLKAYKYHNPATPADSAEYLKPEDVIAFYGLRNPLAIWQPISPMSATSRSIDTDNSVTKHIKRYFDQGGMPPYVIKTKTVIRDLAQADRIREQFAARYAGAANWSKPAVLDEDADIKTLGSQFREMDFSNLDARTETRICAALRVPPILVGGLFGLSRSTFSNYESARLNWWQDEILPLYKRFEDVLDYSLVPDFGGGVYSAFDTSEVAALMPLQEANRKWAIDGFDKGVLTRNEARAEVGYEPVENGDVFSIPNTRTEVSSDEPLETDGDQSNQQDEMDDDMESVDMPDVKAIHGDPLPPVIARDFKRPTEAEIERWFKEWEDLD